ncbi:MAG: DUF1724 domain-containing protein [Methanomicrobiaceae archaeon]|uniref:Transcriptional regulator, arsr family n=1 Tax=hydrocarbon metagenome TaxID=938273 RepID=A0A0W8FKY0_9ZZZZ|nr:DUF1724 domain-containing protein [Methanomicrobiaceae archaeon]MDD5418953.1 DUF1724 domain-containing protein [Methanomicrobiaceae archaeon]
MKIFASDRRVEVLDALLHGETKDQIKARVPASTFAFTVNYLKNVGFAEDSGGEISLTDRGRAYLIIFEQFHTGIKTLRRLFEAFPDHIIYLPDEFFMRLHEISDFEVVTSEASDVMKPHRVFFEYVSRSKEIIGVSPFLFTDFPDFFKGLAGKMDSISLVLTKEVFDIISAYPIEEYDNIEISVIDGAPKIGVAVTDTVLSIGFYYKSGSYDFTRDLIATSPDAIAFGKDLVEHYRRQSRKII